MRTNNSYGRSVGVVLFLLLQFFSHPPAVAEEISWNEVRNWAYQLQGYTGDNLDEIANSAFDLVVIDYSSDGTESGEWLPAEIETARTGPGGSKKIVAYMSIGQAENYRFYWQNWWQPGNPGWLLEEDPDWPGNYWVKFWNPGWQSVIMGNPDSYLDCIISQGFDGVYLDRVDAYEEDFAQGHEQDMVNFVISIAQYARANSPFGEDFAIFPQNAAPLGEHQDYLDAVNGTGKEETYFLATDVPTTTESRFWDEIDLDRFLSAGPWGFGLVLEVDYASRRKNIDFVYNRCENFTGYLPYCTTVDLDFLTVNPGHEPENSSRIWGNVSLDGVPVEGARIDIVRWQPRPLVHKWFDSTPYGRYRFRNLSDGTFYLRAVSESHVSDIIRVTIEDDQTTRVDLILE